MAAAVSPLTSSSRPPISVKPCAVRSTAGDPTSSLPLNHGFTVCRSLVSTSVRCPGCSQAQMRRHHFAGDMLLPIVVQHAEHKRRRDPTPADGGAEREKKPADKARRTAPSREDRGGDNNRASGAGRCRRQRQSRFSVRARSEAERLLFQIGDRHRPPQFAETPQASWHSPDRWQRALPHAVDRIERALAASRAAGGQSKSFCTVVADAGADAGPVRHYSRQVLVLYH